MGTVNGSPSYTSSGGHKWYAYCSFPDSGTGTATVGIKVELTSATSGHLFIDTVAYIDDEEVGTFRDTYYDVPTTKAIGTKNVGPGSHTFKVTFRNSSYNINGNSSGSFSVATPIYAPSYNSTSAGSISSSGVTLTASINNGGATITSGGWQLFADGGSTWTTYSGDWTSKTITGLSRNTTYTYRGYATNSIGTTYSSNESFTTLKEVPVISNPSVSNITSNSAYISYTIIDTGGGTISSNVIKVYDMVQDILVATINSNAGTVTGLSPDTLYAVDGQATNEAGTSAIRSTTFITLVATSNIKTSINGGSFTTDVLKVSINGGGFITIPASKIKKSINGGNFS